MTVDWLHSLTTPGETSMAKMNRLSWLLAILVTMRASVSFAQTPQEPAFSIDRIRADIKFLASDELQGRGIGSRGEDLAIDHIAKQFEKAALRPAGERGGFFQTVPLVLVNTGPKA